MVIADGTLEQQHPRDASEVRDCYYGDKTNDYLSSRSFADDVSLLQEFGKPQQRDHLKMRLKNWRNPSSSSRTAMSNRATMKTIAAIRNGFSRGWARNWSTIAEMILAR